MTSYRLEKEIQEKKIIKKKISKTGLHMKPKLKERKDFVLVKEIIIVNPTLQEKVLKMQFNLAFRRLLKLVIEVVEDETATSGDVGVALSEVERMKNVLKDKYKKNVSSKEYFSMWRKAEYLEQELEKKAIVIKQVEKMYFKKMMTNFIEPEEERGRGR